MRKRKLKKGLAWILACALFIGDDPGEYAGEGTKKQRNCII